MNPQNERKIDRRTLYTQNVIKDAVLELLHEMPFDRITVSALCRQAEITRPTFYLHYDNLSDVLDSLIEDALSETGATYSMERLRQDRMLLNDLSNTKGLDKKLSLTPCQRGASDSKYIVLFEDRSVFDYIVERLYRRRIVTEGQYLVSELGLSRKLSEQLLRFTIWGSFSLNRMFRWKKDKDWYRAHRMILTFLIGGLEAIRNDGHLLD